MTFAGQNGITVRRALMRGTRMDGIAARRNTERLLAQIPGGVVGLGASVVLCVRQMSVRVQRNSHHPRSSSGALGMGMAMDDLVRLAARPALGFVPLNADAVLFADHAEMLSCMARDQSRHLLAQGWWWRVLLNTPNLSRAAVQLWVSEAAHVPTAFARLTHSGYVLNFVQTLDVADANAITQAVVRAHGLALLVKPSVDDSHARPMTAGVQPIPRPTETYTSNRAQLQEIVDALPEVWTVGLSREQRRLLALGLSLVRLPRLVRSSSFAQLLPVLLAQANTHCGVADHIAKTVPNEDALANVSLFQENRFKANARGSDAIRSSFEQATDSTVSTMTDVAFSAPDVFSSKNSSADLSPNPSLLQQSKTSGLSRPGTSAAYASRALETGATDKVELMNIPVSHERVRSLEHTGTWVVNTQFGGAFFLCNAALALGLYADFTRPLDRGLELVVWDFLALAVSDLGGPAVRRDPLWPLLAELAGRAQGQRPGVGFAPPSEWRMPVEWLAPFATETGDWTWEAGATRLVVRHTAGFVLLDVLRNDLPPEKQMQAELALYPLPSRDGEPGIRQTSRGRRVPASPLARWRGWVMPYLGRRVARALGDARWQHACRQLLCLPGRIELDAERLAVYFSLEQLPVAVRMAGLDRDPGWIPAAGRDLRFYFGCGHA
jgi:hypothetical protein